uniref:Uncharacterized protein n=1 Tax=Anopheles atroparvus TaxID=41427 RepID=A0A182J751_ANOAO
MLVRTKVRQRIDQGHLLLLLLSNHRSDWGCRFESLLLTSLPRSHPGLLCCSGRFLLVPGVPFGAAAHELPIDERIKHLVLVGRVTLRGHRNLRGGVWQERSLNRHHLPVDTRRIVRIVRRLQRHLHRYWQMSLLVNTSLHAAFAGADMLACDGGGIGFTGRIPCDCGQHEPTGVVVVVAAAAVAGAVKASRRKGKSGMMVRMLPTSVTISASSFLVAFCFSAATAAAIVGDSVAISEGDTAATDGAGANAEEGGFPSGRDDLPLANFGPASTPAGGTCISCMKYSASSAALLVDISRAELCGPQNMSMHCSGCSLFSTSPSHRRSTLSQNWRTKSHAFMFQLPASRMRSSSQTGLYERSSSREWLGGYSMATTLTATMHGTLVQGFAWNVQKRDGSIVAHLYFMRSG